MRTLGKLLKWGLLLGLGLALLGVAVAAGMYRYYVVQQPAPQLERDHILQLISQESPVYYADGHSKMGVFFSEEHRQYLPYEEIPQDFVNALVSSEDQDFFEHPGFSVQGIVRAFANNLIAGRTVGGGSTLTQQTAKNLFGRRARSYTEKLRELGNALRLERMYSKEEILEFYANQFYVNGNGRGLAIAARYFFDKGADQLDLLESAFLAGVVKGPETYNPFTGSEARRGRARQRAQDRVEYVLGRMLEEGFITTAQRDEALSREIPFNRGRFRFARSVVLDRVEAELRRPEFTRLLASQGVEELGSAGLRVVTSIDRAVQRDAEWALRHHLTETGGLLEVPQLTAFFQGEGALRPVDEAALEVHSFHTASLVERRGGELVFDLGGVTGLLDAAGVQRVADALVRGRKGNTWSRARRADVEQLLSQAEELVGQRAQVSIRGREDGELLVDLEWVPELQGAVIVLQGGEIKAMVGGSSNTDFNRALAPRQLGSTWKPLLFQAALHLRWLPTDPLPNTREVFPYQGTFYYPRPDHKHAPAEVSIAWAAAKSENLASVWLLAHLTDRLNPIQLQELAGRVDLLPRQGEDRADYARRMQKAGIVPSSERLLDGLFAQARGELEPDLIFEGLDDQVAALRSLHYGDGMSPEMERVRRDLGGAERDGKLEILKRNLKRQRALATELASRRDALAGRAIDELQDADLDRFWLDPRGRVVFGELPGPDARALTVDELAAMARGSAVVPPPEAADAPEVEPAEPPATPSGGGRPSLRAEAAAHLDHIAAELEIDEPVVDLVELLSDDVVLLEGLLTPAVVAMVEDTMRAARDRLGDDPDLYAPEHLRLLADYRQLVGMRYVIGLAREAGVEATINPVLSLPLGSVEISLLDAARIYQQMLVGSSWTFYPDALAAAPGGPTSDWAPQLGSVGLVREIRGPDDRVLFRSARERRIVESPAVRGELVSMLQAVVERGTGRRAARAVSPTSSDPTRAAELQDARAVMPLMGKTGTTNGYANAAFCGLVPGLDPETATLAADQGAIITSYVGYDDNRPMRNKSIRLSGASGALPVWIGAAQGQVSAGPIGDRVDLVDLAFSESAVLPMRWPDDLQPVEVAIDDGLPAGEREVERYELRARAPEARAFAPITRWEPDP